MTILQGNHRAQPWSRLGAGPTLGDGFNSQSLLGYETPCVWQTGEGWGSVKL